MNVLGLDLSTVSTGWAIVDENIKLVDKGIIDFVSKTPHKERMVILSELIQEVLDKNDIGMVVIEDTYVAKNVATTKLLNKYSGVAIYTVYKKCPDTCDIAVLSPQTIRSAHFPKSKKQQTKEYMYHYIVNKFSLPPETVNDLTDAIAAACTPHLKEIDSKWLM